MLTQPDESKQVSPFFVAYIVHSMQIGIGILGFERYIAKDAGYDAWIGIILSGFTIHILIWMVYKILGNGQNDIVGVHSSLFGKWIGGLFSICFIVYFCLFSITIVRSYTEVIQVWMFPGLNTWYLSFILLLLVYFAVTGGFRVIVGLCFLGIVYTIPLLLLKWFPLKEADFTNLLPIMNHRLMDLFKSSKIMTLNYLGFEVLLFCYPFIKRGKSSQKWAHAGLILSILVYLFTAVVSFAYFTQRHLNHIIWPTLSLWQTVDLPFIQRFEYVGITLWLFQILPNICMFVWAGSRGLKRLFGGKQKHMLMFILLLIFLASIRMTNRGEIDFFTTIVGRVGFYTLYFYIPCLFAAQIVMKRVRKKA
ncbi:GerAB/ArcD/ProY family transporter [Peribacillus kribbensis]|uniref:GerAB/ArcD/ProY family transporter n=1 Tax=Peribacillus kribbensis TaxID=356658 RepID=UPI00040F3A9E|nr:GerAB/ArcD/ProY family transporter [Peribacillus kribbensis]